jgi:hypothetical protein
MEHQRNTPPINRDVARQREADVVRLRTRDRLTFREIATELNCDSKAVREAWHRVRTRQAHEASQQLDAWRGEQLATLDAVIDGMMPKALAGDPRAAEAIVRALERTARTLGTDAPTRVNATVTDEMTARIKALAEELAEA